VQVIPDLLGLLAGRPPRHARPFTNLRERAIAAIEAWRAEVEAGSFPGAAESIEGDEALRSALAALAAIDPARDNAPHS
jgi:ketopantoate hydroxymethyltransferase